jgi:hypothetical protein
VTEVLLSALAFALAFAGGLCYSSFFEWLLHRHLMHSTRFLRYPHRAHQLEHHGIFKADGSYFLGELHEAGDEKHLTFAWWNVPVLLSVNLPIFAGLYFWVGIWPALGVFAAMVAYYAAYEYLHYCMHVPRVRRLERSRWFRAIQAHHRAHHVYYFRNLNVVLPLADWVLGTKVRAEPEIFEKLERVRRERAERKGSGAGASSR